jgi:predicted enzyme related to lactoylglutathione lyase
MRFDIYIGQQSAADAVRFYVDELGLFELAEDYGMNDFLLRAKGNSSIGIHVGERGEHAAVFGFRVANCRQLYERLQHTVFASGARIASPLTEGPGLKSMVLSDPSGNRVVVFEDASADQSPRLDVFLRVNGALDAVNFYVKQLGWFEVAEDFGTSDYLLLSTKDQSLALHISESQGDPAETPLFAISEACPKREFMRLQEIGVIGADAELFDWPGGINFGVTDPAGNRMLVYEDYIVPAGD